MIYYSAVLRGKKCNTSCPAEPRVRFVQSRLLTVHQHLSDLRPADESQLAESPSG